MTREEFSNEFEIRAASYRRFRDFDAKESMDTIEFDEYEKSLWLTKAQDDLVVSLYSGKNVFGDSFENTEELRRYLDELVKTKVYSTSERTTGTGVSPTSVFYTLPDDLAFITFEQVTLSDTNLGCFDGSRGAVKPVTQDEYTKVRNNPFSGPTRYKVLRMDTGDGKVELISKFNVGEYMIKYLAQPTPIILEDLPADLSIRGEHNAKDCALNPMLHSTILDRAVQMALASKGLKVRND